jgi:Ca-activated chloride channel family protein
LAKLPGDRVGLIAFAGKPTVKVPLTTDQGFFLTVLDDLDTNSAPRGGSLIGDAIRKGIEAMPKRADRDQVMLLITDGEDHDSFPEEAAKQAAQRGIKIFTVGMGDSKDGARVPIRDASGKLQYLKDKNDEIVWSKTNQGLLKSIALHTGAAHVAVGTKAYDLGQIYEDNLAELARGKGYSEKRKRHREQFQLFVCLGMVLLMANMAVPDYRRTNNHSQEIDK